MGRSARVVSSDSVCSGAGFGVGPKFSNLADLFVLLSLFSSSDVDSALVSVEGEEDWREPDNLLMFKERSRDKST